MRTTLEGFVEFIKKRRYSVRVPRISVVLPVMNEIENIEPITNELKSIFSQMSIDYEILFVCDPSSDGTEFAIKRVSKFDSRVKGIFLADRAGQTEAIRAGYEHSTGDAVVSMDVDFQDPPELLFQMIENWQKGSLIVHTRRGDRSTDTLIYRLFTSAGYKFLGWMTKGKVQHNVGDYRLIDRSIIALVLKFGDPNPFWRGITSLSGVPTAVIQYKRPSRRSGETKYHVRIGSPAIALRGMASFSNKPLEILQTLGIMSVFVSAIVVVGIVTFQLVSPGFPRGIPTVIALLAIFFSIQFVSTAIVATYLIVLVEQTRRRPNYLVLPDSKREN
jgi:polyisoprenyl-phosphate glycosyltransferase